MSPTTYKPVTTYTPVVTPQAMYALRGYDEDSVQLCAGPAYHAAPLAFDIRAAMGGGATLVFLDKWDSERTLRTSCGFTPREARSRFEPPVRRVPAPAGRTAARAGATDKPQPTRRAMS